MLQRIRFEIEILRLHISGFFLRLRCRYMEWRFRKLSTKRTMERLIHEIETNPESRYTYLEGLPSAPNWPIVPFGPDAEKAQLESEDDDDDAS